MKGILFFIMLFVGCTEHNKQFENEYIKIRVHFQHGIQIKDVGVPTKDEKDVFLTPAACIEWGGHGTLFCGVEYFEYLKD